MSGPHDPNQARSAGLALGDAGEETGDSASTKEEGTVKGPRTPTRFWLGIAALLLGLATLALGWLFFSSWPGVLSAETLGAGLALLAMCALLLTSIRRDTPAVSPSAADAPDRSAEPSPAATLASPDVAHAAPPPIAPAATTLEAPAAPAPAPTPERVSEPVGSSAEQPEASAAAAPDAPAAPTAPSKPARPKTDQAKQNGQAAASAARPRPKAAEDVVLPRPLLTNLPQGYTRPADGYALDAEAEDLSQLLGDVAEQSVIALATRGQRGTERRERMAGKIDAFSQDMAVDPNFAPVVAFLDAISALLRAGKPIPASQALVAPFDELYHYVLILIRRKTGKTHD